MLKKVESKLLTYHTREIRREFVQQIVNLGIEIPKDLIQGIHTELTREPSAYQNQEVDESYA